jgi:hypothetical protein
MRDWKTAERKKAAVLGAGPIPLILKQTVASDAFLGAEYTRLPRGRKSQTLRKLPGGHFHRPDDRVSSSALVGDHEESEKVSPEERGQRYIEDRSPAFASEVDLSLVQSKGELFKLVIRSHVG